MSQVPILGYPNKLRGTDGHQQLDDSYALGVLSDLQGVDSASLDSKNVGAGSRSSSKSPEQS
jgi:hypothetical protein